MNEVVISFFILLHCRHVRLLDTNLYPIANENAFFFVLLYGERKWENLLKILMI